MTNYEEAIIEMQRRKQTYIDSHTDAYLKKHAEAIDAYDLAINALREQEPKYCDRNICIKNEYNGIGCDECEVTKSQEPCEDCISRAEAINAISHAEVSFQVESDLNFENYKREVQEIADGILKGQVKAISDLPSVQPKPKTGHWIQTNEFFINQDGQFIYNFICSECKSLSYFRTSNKKAIGANVCPNCGAKMKSEG